MKEQDCRCTDERHIWTSETTRTGNGQRKAMTWEFRMLRVDRSKMRSRHIARQCRSTTSTSTHLLREAAYLSTFPNTDRLSWTFDRLWRSTPPTHSPSNSWTLLYTTRSKSDFRWHRKKANKQELPHQRRPTLRRPSFRTSTILTSLYLTLT